MMDPVTLGMAKSDAAKKYTPRVQNSIIPLGTSFTEGNYGPGTANPTRYQDRGYFNWAMAFLGQRLNWVRNAGIPGNTTAQMLARIDADVIAYKPGWCLIEVGPNDATNNVTPADTQANITAMLNKLRAAGIRIAVTTPTTTNGQTTAQKNAALAVGTWLRALTRTTPGIVLVDFGQVFTAPADGTVVNPYTDDGTHPSADGAKQLGLILANALAPFVPNVNDLPATNIDPTNLLTNGMMYGNASGLANGVGVNGSGTTPVSTQSKVLRTDLYSAGGAQVNGWQRMAVGPGNNAVRAINWATITTGFSVGDTVQAMVEWRMLASPAPVAAAGLVPSINVTLIAVGGGTQATWGYHTSSDKAWTLFPTQELVSLTPPLLIPSGTTSLVLQLNVNGMDTITVDAGRAKVFKV